MPWVSFFPPDNHTGLDTQPAVGLHPTPVTRSPRRALGRRATWSGTRRILSRQEIGTKAVLTVALSRTAETPRGAILDFPGRDPGCAKLRLAPPEPFLEQIPRILLCSKLIRLWVH